MKKYRLLRLLLVFFLSIFVNSSFSQENILSDNLQDTTRINKLIQKADSTFNLNFSHDKQDYSVAFGYLNSAEEIALQLDNLDFKIKVNNKYTDLWVQSGNFSLALEHAFANLNLMDNAKAGKESLQIIKKRILQYSLIGYCYVNLENTEKAMFYLNKAYSMIEQNFQDDKDPYIIDRKAAILNNIASAYLTRKDIKNAKEYYKRSTVYIKKSGNDRFLAAVYNNLGICEQHEKRDEISRDYFERSLKIRLKIKDSVGMAQSYNNLGTYYISQGNNEKALFNLDKALYFARRSNGVKSEIVAAHLLSDIYAQKGDFKKAFEMFNLYNQLNDSIMGMDRVRYSTQLEMQYQYEKQRKDKEFEDQVKQVKNQRKIFLLVFIIIGLGLLFVIFMLLYRFQRIQSKKNILQKERLELESKNLALEKENLSLENQNLELSNQKLEADLEHKNKELTTHVMYLLKKNEFLNTILDKLNNLKEDIPVEEKAAMRQLIASIHSNIDESSWEEFEVRFQNVHQDFYKKLNEVYPNLSPNETKICSFLRLNMSTKEISSITFQSVKSIEVARTRLRKKLGLERDDNLVSLLQKL